MSGVNVLIIGNGFDVYHKLETRYIDFVRFVKSQSELDSGGEIESICKTNPFIKHFIDVIDWETEEDKWIDCEEEIKVIISVFKKTFDAIQRNDSRETYTGQEQQVIINFSKYFEDIEDVMNFYRYFREEYERDFRKFEKKKLLSNIKSDLDDVITVLEYYLKDVCEEANITKKSSQLLKTKFDFVVNFNYTDTYKLYDIEEENAFYIHGKLGKNPNNMVLGFSSKDEEQFRVEKSDVIYFEKYFQRIQKKLGVLDEERFLTFVNIGERKRGATTHFFGHSMSVSDGDIIERIIEKLSDYVIIYYYDQVDYEEKVASLIEILGKERMLGFVSNEIIQFVKIWDEETEGLLSMYREKSKADFQGLVFMDERKVKETINKYLG